MSGKTQILHAQIKKNIVASVVKVIPTLFFFFFDNQSVCLFRIYAIKFNNKLRNLLLKFEKIEKGN